LSQLEFSIRQTALPGCIEISPPCHDDLRGRFVKIMQHTVFDRLGLPVDFPEVFYSVSHRDVIRGLHFQTPPADQGKLVYCTHGKILDAVVDLRAGSPVYGRHILLELDAMRANMLYIPPGMAHGFRTLSESATVVYHVSSEYAPECDKGIRWDSAGIDWGINTPTLSVRDKQHPPLSDFDTPFHYGAQC